MKSVSFDQLIQMTKYEEAISIFLEEYRQVINSATLTDFRYWLTSFPNEAILKDYIKVADTALMGKLSTVLVKANVKRLHSPMIMIWYCEELMNEHKLIEAEERLKELLQYDLTSDEEEKLYFVLAEVLMHMQRFSEAKTYMVQCEKKTKEPMNTRWGYYYLLKGDWQTAINFLGAGKLDKKDGSVAYALLIQHYAIKGKYELAESLIDEGLVHHPNDPKLLVEKIRLLYQMKRWVGMRKSITHFNQITPYSDYRRLFEEYFAESYYQVKSLSDLTQLLEECSHLKRNSLFKEFNGAFNLPAKKLTYKPTIQKYNYCVPASLEMILSQYRHMIDQDLIADSVFSVTGTKLSKAIEFMEKQGYTCKFFYGSVDHFKCLLDADVGIMINVDYPMSSHVQVVVGYDDNLRVLYVHDPNRREAYPIKYDEVEKEYENNKVLALAIVPKNEEDRLLTLDNQQHELVSRMIDLAEVGDSVLSSKDEEFIQNNLNEFIVAVYTIRYLPKHISLETLEKAIHTVRKHLVNSEYCSLIIAYAFCQRQELDYALSNIERNFSKTNQSTYWFLRGRIYFDKDEYRLALKAFGHALNDEPDDPIVWTYLALSNSRLGDSKLALQYSRIALDINKEDTFVLASYGDILYEAKDYKEARNFFHQLLKTNKVDEYFWYERARCDVQLGRYTLARKGFQIAISLKRGEPHPYIELANLYDQLDQDEKRAEKVLLEGLLHTQQSPLLLHELGNLYERAERYDEARTYLIRALDINPNDVFSWISLGSLMKSEGKYVELFDFMEKRSLEFNLNSEFLINAGMLLWEAATEVKVESAYFERALYFIEKGITCESDHLKDCLELYVEAIGNTAYYRRGIHFLEKEYEKDKDNSLYYLCYIGYLYEINSYFHKAKQYFERAISIKNNEIFPYFRLGEIAFRLEKYKEAEIYFQKVLQFDSSYEQAYLNLASIASDQNDKINEKKYLLNAFQLNPYCIGVEDLVDVIDEEEEIQELLECLKKSMKMYDQVFILDSIAYAYGKLGDIVKEEEYLNAAMLKQPNLSHLMYHQIKLWIKKGKNKQAKESLLSLIEKHVDDRDLYKLLIENSNNIRSIAKLEEELTKLKLEPSDRSTAFMNLASEYEKVFLSKGQSFEQLRQSKGIFKKLGYFTRTIFHVGGIINFYEKAIKIDKENITAVMWLADFYINEELLSDAIKVLEQAFKQTSHIDIAYRLAALYADNVENVKAYKKNRYLSKARDLLKFCLNVQEDPEYMNLLGHVLLEQEELLEAEAIFLRCLSIEPTINGGYFNLGRIYIQLEKFTKAEQASKKAIELEPDNEEYYNQLALIFHYQGQDERALDIIQTAIKLDSDDLYFQYNRAIFLIGMGRMREAAKQLEEVFELDEYDYFFELAEEDDEILPLKKAGYFPGV
ncbi:hypothetical protein J6TS2_14290 [Heyndrickxia sporothermodurans]|nr:hypothetical protein J6TS2_14290 [Heyndrickxia sporothermodurans]